MEPVQGEKGIEKGIAKYKWSEAGSGEVGGSLIRDGEGYILNKGNVLKSYLPENTYIAWKLVYKYTFVF